MANYTFTSSVGTLTGALTECFWRKNMVQVPPLPMPLR